MNFGFLRESLDEITAILPIDRFAELNGVMCNFMGLTLNKDGACSLLWLEYDHEYREKAEEAEFTEPEPRPKALTNRMKKLMRSGTLEPRDALGNVSRVSFGGAEFASSSGGSTQAGNDPWRKSALYTRFMLAGWQANGFDWPDLDYAYLKHLELDGTFREIPEIDTVSPISFSMFGGVRRSHPQVPVTLTVGEERQTLSFDLDEENISITIEQVHLLDMYAECESKLEKIKDKLSPEDLAEQRKAVFEMLEENCPRGMLFPAVEYTAPEGVSLHFHSAAWLESIPAHRGGSRSGVFMVKSDSGNKCALIQEPFPPGTNKIEAELFTCSQVEKPRTVTI